MDCYYQLHLRNSVLCQISTFQFKSFYSTEKSFNLFGVLCETSRNGTTEIPDKLIENYNFAQCNSVSGKKQGGVGIFYKE